MKHLIITVIGTDQPGLVETLSDTVYHNHGNWLSSSLSKLAGQFAGILQVEVADEHTTALHRALTDIPSLQVHIVEEQRQTDTPPQLHNMLVTGNDRAGIVKDVTTKLTELGVNINKLKTTTDSAPNWGYPIFTADFRLELPHGLSLEHVQEQIENIADDLNIDIDNN